MTEQELKELKEKEAAYINSVKKVKLDELDEYSNSDEVSKWLYNYNGIDQLQYLKKSDVDDLGNLAAHILANLQVSGNPIAINWTFYAQDNHDNSERFVTMTQDEFLTFFVAAKTRDEFLWNNWGQLRQQILDAQLISDVNAIDIYSGWDLQN